MRRRVRIATKRSIQIRKNFLLKITEGQERRQRAKHSKKGTEASGAAEAARRTLRCAAGREGMRDVVDARRTREADALSAGEHLRAVAPFAQAAVWRIRGGKAAEGGGCVLARRRFRNGVGIPTPPSDSQNRGGCSRAQRWREDSAPPFGTLTLTQRVFSS